MMIVPVPTGIQGRRVEMFLQWVSDLFQRQVVKSHCERGICRRRPWSEDTDSRPEPQARLPLLPLVSTSDFVKRPRLPSASGLLTYPRPLRGLRNQHSPQAPGRGNILPPHFTPGRLSLTRQVLLRCCAGEIGAATETEVQPLKHDQIQGSRTRFWCCGVEEVVQVTVAQMTTAIWVPAGSFQKFKYWKKKNAKR